ncbi:MAG: phage major capsid protein [Streptosporangiaceae bacterium]
MTITFPALEEAQGKLAAAQKSLAEVFTEAGPEMDMGLVKCIDGDSKAKVAWIRAKNAELDDLGDKLIELQDVAKAAQRAQDAGANHDRPKGRERGDGGREPERKSLGDLFTESEAFKGRKGQHGPEAHLDIELKGLFDSTGWTPETTRGPRLVDYVTRPIQLIDLIPGNATMQNAVTFMEETSFVNNAGEVIEGAAYPESMLALTERTSPVRTIGTWIAVTETLLEDVPQARGYVNNRIPFMVRQRLDGQIINGDGTAPNLAGYLNTPGIQTQAKGADNVPDAIYKAMTKVKVNALAYPNAVVMNPTDWQGIRLLKTLDGIYIWGSPSEAGTPRIWGLPIVEAFGLAAGTGLTGDFANYSELVTRRGMDIQVTNSHADFFIKAKLAIRADVRVALVVYRPLAYATITGL